MSFFFFIIITHFISGMHWRVEWTLRSGLRSKVQGDRALFLHYRLSDSFVIKIYTSHATLTWLCKGHQIGQY